MASAVAPAHTQQDRRRVALVFSSFRSGGVERVRLTLARGFLDRGLGVDLVVVNATGPLRDEVPTGARLVDLGKGRTIAAVGALAGYLRRERPSALLVAQTHLNLVTLAARALARVPVRAVVSEHIALDAVVREVATWKERLFPLGIRLLYSRANAVVVVCHATAERFARTSGVPLDRLTVIYNPVVRPELVAQSKAPVDHEWFRDAGVPVILSAGRLTPQKDHATLLRAFAMVRKARPARLLILGEGQERGSIASLASELGVAADVQLPGFQLNPFAYMARAGVFVLSSRWEGFGNVLVEAMACGVPVVSTDCPSGPAEILQDGALGPLVAVGNHEALAAAILRTLQTPPSSDRLRQRASEFTAERAIDRYLQVLLP